VEGRAQMEGGVASIHESYVDGHGHHVAEDAVFTTPCVVIIFDEAPRNREVQTKPESKHPSMTTSRDRASRQAKTREETRPRIRSAVASQGQIGEPEESRRTKSRDTHIRLCHGTMYTGIYPC